MNTKLHVENLEATTSETELAELFSTYGNVVGVHIEVDTVGSRSRGVGFVTMMTPEGARAAVQGLNGTAGKSGALTVREAWPNERSLRSTSGRSPPRRMASQLF